MTRSNIHKRRADYYSPSLLLGLAYVKRTAPGTYVIVIADEEVSITKETYAILRTRGYIAR